MHRLLHSLARWLPARLAARLGVSRAGEKPASGELTAESLRLWVRNGSQCWLGEAVAASSDFLVPEFTLKALRSGTDPPVRERQLTFTLHQGASHLHLGQQTVRLNGEAVRLRGPDIPISGGRCLQHPGRYCVAVTDAGREVARFPFRLVGSSELGKQVKVNHICLTAEKLDGQKMPGLKVFRRDEHQGIWPALRLETGIPAPNSLVPCSVQIQQGTIILSNEEFLLPLDRPFREVHLQRLDLDAATFCCRTKPTRFLLAAYVAGELKAIKPFLLLPTDRITNREGQLLQDAKDLPLDDLEYDQILTSLAIPPPPPPPRRLWR